MAGKNAAISAAEVNSSGLIGAGIQNDGTLGTTGKLIIISNGNTSLSGNTMSAGDMHISSKGDLTNSDLILSQGTTLIKSIRLINTGTIATGNDTLIYGRDSVKSTGLIYAGIDQYGKAKGDLQIDSYGDIDLSGANTVAGNFMLLQSYEGSIFNNNGTIQAGETVGALAWDTINNDNGTIVQTENVPVTQGIHLQANSISNVNGNIQSAGTQGSNVTTVNLLAFQNFSWLGAGVGNNIDNTNGQIVSNGSRCLAGWDINNIGGTVKTPGWMNLLAENAITNTGKIRGSDVVVYAASLNNTDSGTIAGSNSVTLNGKPGDKIFTRKFPIPSDLWKSHQTFS